MGFPTTTSRLKEKSTERVQPKKAGKKAFLVLVQGIDPSPPTDFRRPAWSRTRFLATMPDSGQRPKHNVPE